MQLVCMNVCNLFELKFVLKICYLQAYYKLFRVVTSLQNATTACVNYCRPVLSKYADFSKGEKPEYPEN